MKKITTVLAVLALCVSSFVMTGCISMHPVSDAGSFPADASTYEVLGRVEVTASATKSGYSKLYAEAVKKYPNADDVVNVKVDYKRSTFLIFTSQKYTMSGIAINYK